MLMAPWLRESWTSVTPVLGPLLTDRSEAKPSSPQPGLGGPAGSLPGGFQTAVAQGVSLDLLIHKAVELTPTPACFPGRVAGSVTSDPWHRGPFSLALPLCVHGCFPPGGARHSTQSSPGCWLLVSKFLPRGSISKPKPVTQWLCPH